MGKGGSSCLKIMGCVGDPAENGDFEYVEEKASKRKWRFRKRSDSHTVLNDNVITEPPPIVVNKEDNLEVGENHHNRLSDAHIPVKTPVVKFVEEATLIPPATSESDVSDTFPISKLINDSDFHIEEAVVIVLQSAIRGHLARKELTKRKKVVKLQAAIRGHLIRRQAVGTLRCVQAIVKMQALVRARLLRRSAQELDNEGEVKGTPDTKVHSSTEKLLANVFARQLLESAPSKKSKAIHISCDPSKCDSSWKWLERWMSVTSSVVTPQTELDGVTCIKAKRAEVDVDIINTTAVPTEAPTHTAEQKVQHENLFDFVDPIGNSISSLPLPTDEKGGNVKMDVSEDLIEAQYTDADVLSDPRVDLDKSEDSSNCASTDMPVQNELRDQLFSSNRSFGSQVSDENVQINSDVKKGERNSDLTQALSDPDTNAHSESFTERYTVDLEKSRRTTKKMGNLVESESKKFGLGLRKSSNASFTAAQSKFEELSATTSLSTAYQEKKGDQKPHTFAPKIDMPAKSEIDLVESCDRDSIDEHEPDNVLAQGKGSSIPGVNVSETLLSNETRIPAPISECGTEISISSTLDSPDRSEVEGGEIVLEIGALERRDYDAVLVDGAVSDLGNATFETNNSSKDSEALFQSNIEESGKEEKYTNISDFADCENGTQRSFEEDSPNMSEDGKNIDQQACRLLSHEGSPRNHTTASESQGTPASQISSIGKRTTDRQTYRLTPDGSSRSHITAHGTPDSQISANSNAKRSTTNGSVNSKKPRFQLMGKKSPAEKSIEAGPKSTPENLPKGKKKNSLGTSKPNGGDLEPKVSTSSLPSYMQATESARAKVNASTSPKASPDVNDKETYARKRHSLPLGNVKQALSPRMQRSASQVQQSSKTNSTSPHNSAERKWQR